MRLFLVTAVFLVASPTWAQVITRLDPSDPQDGIFFGWSVAVDPSAAFLAVAAPSAASPGVTAGRVDIYTASGSGWSFSTSLTGGDAVVGDDFGSGLAFSSTESGLYLLVGARDHDAAGTDEGAVFVFAETAGEWNQVDKLLPSEPEVGDAFGRDIDADGGRVIISAHYWNAGTGSDGGAAYIYEFDGDTFIHDATLTTDVLPTDFFGESVAIEDNWAFVGAYNDQAGEVAFAGSVFAFEHVGQHEWAPRQQIIADSPVLGAGFGVSVDVAKLDGLTLAVGAYRDDEERGSVYLFQRDGDVWTQQAKIQADDAEGGDWFGNSVSIIQSPNQLGSGRLAIGARRKSMDGDARVGSAYLFEGVGASWPQTFQLQPADAGPFSEVGYSVALRGDHLVVGAPYTPNNAQVGAAYDVFTGAEVENRPPVARTDWGFGVTDQSVVIDVLANDSDADSDPLEVMSTGNGAFGTTEIVDNRVVYTPANGAKGDDSFGYVVGDGRGGVGEGLVRIRLADPETILFVSTDEEAEGSDPETFRSRRGTLNSGWFFDQPVTDIEVLTLNLFEDVVLVARQERVEQGDETAYSWFGVGPRPGDQVVLEVDTERKTVYGTLWIDGLPYLIRRLDGELYEVRQVNTAALPDEAPLGKRDAGPRRRAGFEVVENSLVLFPDTDELRADKRAATAEIDLLIVYTTQARDSAGLTSDMLDEIRNAVNLTNLTYRNSAIDARVRLAGTSGVAYSETGVAQDDLDNLEDSGQDSGSTINELRRQAKADIVGLVVGDFEACGIGDLMEDVSTDHGEDAYFVVVQGNCLGPNLSFAHEIGHILAARHDRYVDNTDGSPYDYNHGYVNPLANWSSPADQWRTVMAYIDRCTAWPVPTTFSALVTKKGKPFCTRLPIWSDPDSTWAGFPRGIRSGSNAADNVRTLNNTTPVGAAFVSGLPVISGFVTDAATGKGLFDVRMLGSDGSSARTDTVGYYALFVQPGTSLTLTPDFSGYAFEPSSKSFSNVTSDASADFMGFELFTVSGKVTFAPTGAALPAIEMRGVTGLNEVTGLDGKYMFVLPWSWSGTITPYSTEYTFTPPSLILDSLEADTTQDFSAVRNRYIVSGFINEQSGAPVPDVELQGFPDPTFTDDSGGYEIEIEHGWSGTVIPVKEGFDFEPFSRQYIGLSSAHGDDYEAFTGTLGRSIWPSYGADAGNTGSVSAPTVQGELNWSAQMNGKMAPPVLGADGTIIVGTSDGEIAGFNQSGTKVWELPTTFIGIDAAPVVGTGGIVYVVESDISGRVTALSYVTRTQQWTVSTGGAILAAPTIGEGGAVYVGTFSGELVAISPSGVIQWRRPTSGSIYSSPAVAPDGTIYVGSDDGVLYALNPDGTTKWTFTTGDKVRSAPTVGSDGTIYVGSDDDYVYAIRPDGSQKWRVATGGNVRSSAALDSNGNVYIGSDDGMLYALGGAGQVLWTYATTGPIGTAPVINRVKVRRFTQQLDEEVVYVADDNGNLHALNIISLLASADRLRWWYPANPSGTSGPVLTTGGLLVGTQADPGRLLAFRPQSLAWTQGIVLIQDAALTEREVGIAIWLGERGGPLGILGGLPGDDPCIGGPLIIPNCPLTADGKFGDVSPYVSLPADADLIVGLIDGGADVDAVVTGQTTEGLLGTLPLRFEEGETRPLIVAGLFEPENFAENPDGRPTGLGVYAASEIPTESQDPEDVVVVAGHFSTDAGAINISMKGPAEVDFSGLHYGETSDGHALPPGVYEVKMEVPGTTGKRGEDVDYRLDLSSKGGEVVTVLAAGFVDPSANDNGPALGIVAADANAAVIPVSVEEGTPEIPATVKLQGAYPNPFSLRTTISYSLPEASPVTVDVFDVQGRRVRTLIDRRQEAGTHSVVFARGSLPSGLYLFRLVTKAGVTSGRVIALK